MPNKSSKDIIKERTLCSVIISNYSATVFASAVSKYVLSFFTGLAGTFKEGCSISETKL